MRRTTTLLLQRAWPMTTRIILVDDHKIIRDGLRALLGRHASLEVIAEAEVAEE